MDKFADDKIGLTSPATSTEIVTPHDDVPLAFVTRAIYVGQTGDLAVMMSSGQSAVFRNLQSGVIYPLRILKVLMTGTTAGDIIGLR